MLTDRVLQADVWNRAPLPKFLTAVSIECTEGDKYKLELSENRVLRKTVGYKEDKVTRG